MAKKYVSLTRLSNFLDNIKTKYSQIGHKHTISDLTDYKVDTTLSSTSTNPVQNKVLDAEFDAVSDAMSALESAIDSKADSSHTHSNYVPTSRTVNGKALTSNVSLTASDVGALPSSTVIPSIDGLATETYVDDVAATKVDKVTGKGLSTNDFTTAEKNKLSGIAAGAQVNTVTGVKGNSESTYRTGNINITKANIGLGNVDNTADANKSVNYAVSAGSATSATKATQDASGNVITSTYETKSDASAKLTEAKTYADNAATQVKNDLLNNAGGAYDTLKELGDLIDDNTTAIDALEAVAAGKADKVHGHAISDITNLQSTLDGKAASSHGTHVTYSTTAPVMDGTASVGSASTVARSDHKHPTDTSRAAKTDLDSHTSNTTVHITSTERTNWNAAKTHADSAHAPSNAEKNQNAFSNVTVGSTTIAADTTTDTLTLVAGTNVTITPDATNDKITIAATDTTYDAAGSALGLVKSGGDVTISSGVITVNDDSHNHTIANVDNLQSSLDAKQATITGAATTITGSNLTASRALVSDSSGKVAVSAVTSTELGYLDGVTSAIQTQLNGKAASSHGNHVPATETANNAKFLRNDNTWQTVTPANIGAVPASRTVNGKALSGNITLSASDVGASASNHTHDYLPITGGTVTGTTVFSKVQDSAADAYNAPAVVIGGEPTTYHLELDNNEIQAKQNETKAGNLFLNSNGGIVHVGFDGLKMDSESSIIPEAALSSAVGTAASPFNHMYGRYFNVYGAADKQYGRLRVGTTGTTSTAGITTLELGNATATGTAHNASGKITMYGSGTGFTNIFPSIVSGSNTLYLPTGSGTLALDGGGAKIATGSYTGTGTYGSSNPCSLTFDFVPKVLMITRVSNDSTNIIRQKVIFDCSVTFQAFPFLAVQISEGLTYGYTNSMTAGGGIWHKCSLSGKKFTWYNVQSAEYQLNDSASLYKYIVIG